MAKRSSPRVSKHQPAWLKWAIGAAVLAILAGGAMHVGAGGKHQQGHKNGRRQRNAAVKPAVAGGPAQAQEFGLSGTYFLALDPDPGSGLQTLDGRPIQPQLVKDVSVNARGVVFEGGQYVTYAGFDPVVTRLGNSDVQLGSETPVTATAWLPSQLASLRWLETLDGYQQKMVLRVGQYSGPLQMERVYNRATVSLHSSTSSDQTPPGIDGVAVSAGGAITVTVTDDSGICRVLVTHTDGGGEWRSLDLGAGGGNTWQGTLPQSGNVSYFVQVVDQAGNVSVDDNEGRYHNGRYSVYLPLILK